MSTHNFASMGLDFGALSTLLLSWTHIFPSVVAIIALVWYCLEIWDSGTVLRWRARHRMRHCYQRRGGGCQCQVQCQVEKQIQHQFGEDK
jgi:hypothetical protein